MEFTLDLHTHTVASGHAYSTVQEMAKAAADKGLKLLGITEHAQGIPGTCDEIYFHNMRIIPRKMYGIDLMFGSEINIIDHDGTLSMERKLLRRHWISELRESIFHVMKLEPSRKIRMPM